MKIYKQPLYYEIAFGFVNPKKQIDSFEKIIKKFSKIKVKRFLDIACGPSLQLREIVRRGYEGIGLDSSPQMLRYLEKKAKEENFKVETVKADMINFKLKKKADFAFIMMGSLNFGSNDEFLSHLNSVGFSLNKGSLYLIQNQVLNWKNPVKQQWTSKRGGITIKTVFDWKFKNIIDQVYEEKITLYVDDNGKKEKIINKKNLKFIFPQEFKTLVELNRNFEFLGWWYGNCNTWHLNVPLKENKISRGNIIIVRRK